MSGQRYTPEFKDEAVKQVIDRGYTIAEDVCAVTIHKFFHKMSGSEKSNSVLLNMNICRLL